MPMLQIMIRTLKTLAVILVTLSLNSCGLPGALARSAGRLVQGAGNVVNSAAGL